MKTFLTSLIFSVLIAVVLSERAAKVSSREEAKESKIVETVADTKPKRQLEHGRAIADAGQHIQLGSPGHYYLRTPEKSSAASSDQNAAYLSILRQLEGEAASQSSAQARPEVQYIIPRQQQQQIAYAQSQEVSQVTPQAKVLQYQSGPIKRPLQAYQQQQRIAAQLNYQKQKQPVIFRPSQAVKATPVYGGQAFLQNAGGHGLHEARVQAALSVADDKPTYASQQYAQPAYQFQGVSPQLSELSDGSFEKELAQLISANQATELKARPQPQHQPQQAYQYIQQSQIKPSYIQAQSKPKQYAYIQSPDAQSKYVPIITGRAKTPNKQLPQQYLIETTKPQPTQQQPIKQLYYKPRPQYVVSTEEPKYFDFQEYSQQQHLQDDKSNAMKIVPAPQLQRTPQLFSAASTAQKQSEQAIPTYVQYYQTIRPQNEDYSSLNDVKLQTYVPRFTAPKLQAAAQVTTEKPEEQPSYFAYQTQIKAEEAPKYPKFKSVNPQVTAQFSSEDDSLIQSLLAQSLQKQRQGLSGFATAKTASTQLKPLVAQQPTPPSHSSIFVSKASVPKKPVAPVEAAASEEEETPVVRLPPPKNNKVYTQEEFQALVAAGYSVTPVPVIDDDDSKGAFSLAPVNYPGHSKYHSYAVESSDPQTYQNQPTEAYATVTEAPRVRKHKRPISRYHYSEDSNSGSESQSKLSYSSLQPAETINYGMRTKAKVRTVAPVAETSAE